MTIIVVCLTSVTVFLQLDGYSEIVDENIPHINDMADTIVKICKVQYMDRINSRRYPIE